METIQFTKMEGTANDYVFIDEWSGTSSWPAGVNPDSPAGANLIRQLADRHRGVGGDGVVFIRRPQSSAGSALARMRMYNADGSSSAMCGNALRAIALFAHEQSGEQEFVLESDSGRHATRVLAYDAAARQGVFEVDLGPPIFEADRVPFRADQALSAPADGPLVDVRLPLPDGIAVPGLNEVPAAVVLSMGNPHCVLFVDDADRAFFEELGPILEHHPAFPERTNVEFVSIEETGPQFSQGHRLYQRTYERGTGETFSCGSGACAVHVAGVLTGRQPARGRIRVRGGELELEWQGSPEQSAGVLMRGPARVAFTGEWRGTIQEEQA